MELCQGGELFDYIVNNNTKHFSEKEVATLVTQIARGLRTLHMAGVVHRDLKPENVRIFFTYFFFPNVGSYYPYHKNTRIHTHTHTQVVLKYDIRKNTFPSNSLKIMDFGFSLLNGEGCEGKKSQLMVVGSPQYMAPEICRAYFDGTNPEYEPACDVWALGVIMYILLSGRMPFETRRGNVLDAHRAVVSESPNWDKDTWGHVSSDAIDLVKRMLVKDPKKRISVVDVLKHGWIVNRTCVCVRA